MISRDQLASNFTLYDPASEADIKAEEDKYGAPLPKEYLEFARISDGAYTQGNLNILGVEGIVQRNQDYEVQEYLPDYFMIGDNGGGIAVLIRKNDGKIYEVEMGIMDEETMRFSAASLDELLVNLEGKSLVERGGW